MRVWEFLALAGLVLAGFALGVVVGAMQAVCS